MSFLQVSDMKYFIFMCLFLTLACEKVFSLTAMELQSMMGNKACIEGVLVSMPHGPTLITSTIIPQKSLVDLPLVQYDVGNGEQIVEQYSTNSSVLLKSKAKENSPMSLINQLAQYNEIKYQYYLNSEEGSAHNKKFTVTLQLGHEEYEAEGTSIKKAQHAAATIALQETAFQHPRASEKTKSKLTPTVELNNLAMKRGETPVYELINNSPGLPAQNYKPQTSLPSHKRSSYDPLKNNSARTNPIYNAKHFEDEYTYQRQHGGPFTTRLRIGKREYIGTGYTVKSSRHDAAAKAIEDIKQEDDFQQCPAKALQNDVCNNINMGSKSPISLLYEIASKRNKNLVFEVISEKGPSHKKVFVTQCSFGQLVTEGEGNGKQISKKIAAEKMLDELSKLGSLPEVSSSNTSKRKGKKKKKQRNLIKMNLDRSIKNNEKVHYSSSNKERGHSPVSGLPLADDVSASFQQKNDQAATTSSTRMPSDMKKKGQTQTSKKASVNQSSSSKDQLIYLAQLLGVQLQFSDFPKIKQELYLTLVSLSTTPPQVCQGEGPTTEKSHEKAASEALRMLSKLGLDQLKSTKESNTDDVTFSVKPEIEGNRINDDLNKDS